jgi:hypothetical protein
VPVPHAGHGHVVHACDVKKSTHVPCAQTWFVWQATPHAPQSSGSLFSSCWVKQPPPGKMPLAVQKVRPAGQRRPEEHTPSVQSAPPSPEHLFPHVPQLFTSCSRSVHVRPQAVRRGRHEQVLAKQPCAELQTMSQAPQSWGSVCRSAQTVVPPLMHLVPALQAHIPLEQTAPCSQALRQLPQWLGSVLTFAQVPPHMMSPIGHVQTPETQESPAGQAFAQLPQWLGSFEGSMQPMLPPQLMSPVEQVQTPLTHTAFGPHFMPQPPQSFGSVAVFTQPIAAPQ